MSRRGRWLTAGVVATALVASSARAADESPVVQALADRLSEELAQLEAAASIQTRLVELDRQAGGVDHAADVADRASSEGGRKLAAYRRTRAEREALARDRARSLYKLARGGALRLYVEQAGSPSPTDRRVPVGRSLRFLLRHDALELSIHRRSQRRQEGEIAEAARELRMLGAGALVRAMQEHVLVSASERLDASLDRARSARKEATAAAGSQGWLRLHPELEQVRQTWQSLQKMRGLEAAAALERPVAGRVVAGFGEDEDLATGVSVLRNGVELHAWPNRRVAAFADGTVSMVTTIPGMEEAVILDHGAGQYSLTARLWRLSVREGDRVRAGERIGYVAPKTIDDGLGSTLYFELRHAGKPIDPEPYLARARARASRDE